MRPVSKAIVKLSVLHQGLADCDLWATAGPLPVSVWLASPDGVYSFKWLKKKEKKRRRIFYDTLK